MTNRRRLLIVIAILLGFTSCAKNPSAPKDDPPADDAWVALFSGRGAWPEGVSYVSENLTAAGLQFRQIGMETINRNELDGAWLLIMPGGQAGFYSDDVSPAGITALRERVNAGMGYLGICAGAYFAAEHVIWWNVEVPYPVDIYAGVADGPVTAITPHGGQADADILVNSHEANAGLAGSLRTYYYEGPELEGGEILATYAMTGQAAAVVTNFGAGPLLLSGVHPEDYAETRPLFHAWLQYLRSHASVAQQSPRLVGRPPLLRQRSTSNHAVIHPKK